MLSADIWQADYLFPILLLLLLVNRESRAIDLGVTYTGGIPFGAGLAVQLLLVR